MATQGILDTTITATHNWSGNPRLTVTHHTPTQDGRHLASGALTMLNHTLPKIILASVPLLCAAQFCVLRTYGEPYPALILPSFGSSTPRQFQERQDVVLLANGKVIRTVTIDEFLPHIQRSIRPRLVNRNLRPKDECSAETRAWLVELGRQLEPATDAVEIRWMHITKAGSEWSGTFPKP